MKREDIEDLIQNRHLAHMEGTRAKSYQIDIDFLRKTFGDSRYKSKDAMFYKSYANIENLQSRYVGKLDEFLDTISELALDQRIILVLMFCGLTTNDLMKLYRTYNRKLKQLKSGKLKEIEQEEK